MRMFQIWYTMLYLLTLYLSDSKSSYYITIIFRYSDKLSMFIHIYNLNYTLLLEICGEWSEHGFYLAVFYLKTYFLVVFARNRAWFSVCNKNPSRASIMIKLQINGCKGLLQICWISVEQFSLQRCKA